MNKKPIFQTHKIFLFVLAKYLLAFLLLMLTQLVFYIVNSSLFSIGSFREALFIILGNIHFGIATTAIIMVPYFVLNALPISLRWNPIYKKISEIFYIVPVILMMMANLIDIPYFQWTFRRTTGDIFKYLSVGGDMGNLIPQFLSDFWMYVLIFGILLILLCWGSRKIVLLPRKPYPYASQIIKDFILSIIFIGFVIIAIRGGVFFQYKPLAPIDASKYAISGNTPLVINTPFSIIRTINHSDALPQANYFNSQFLLEDIYTPHSSPLAIPDTIGSNKTNVVLIILESFSEEYIGFLNKESESFTPFLDSLSRHSTVYQGMANGKRSIEAIPALLAGIPSLMVEPYITSTYSMNKIVGLPEILKKHNYFTAFFHGAYNGSMNFDGFAKSIGIDQYYGMNEYNDKADYDGNWGIFDEPFLQFMAGKLSTFPEPFFATVFTLSSHHPYTIPTQYVGKFKKGKLPILETVMYVDNALRLFFKTVSKTDWYRNTLFVITADHSAQAMKQKYNTNYGMYKIPMIFYKPDSEAGTVKDQIFQQIDLMPTLIDYLRINEQSFSFGKSVYQTETGFHIAYRSGYYQLIKDNYLITFNDDKFEIFNLEEDPLATHNIASEHTMNLLLNQNKNYLKAIIQQYNTRMIENRLTVK